MQSDRPGWRTAAGRKKFVSAKEAVRLIRKGDTIATGGFVGIGMPEGVVNYEDFVLDRGYLDVTRYTSSAFLRAKLGAALSRRKLAPHVFETEDEALAALRPGAGS